MQINGVRVSDSQAAVYGVVKQYGGRSRGIADHALVPLAQHQLGVHLSSSGIRSRRAELFNKGLLREGTPVRTGSGRKARTFVAA